MFWCDFNCDMNFCDIMYSSMYDIHVFIITLWISCWWPCVLVSSECTAGWKYNHNDDSCYYFSNYTLNRMDAYDYCENNGGHLATDNNNATHYYILSNKPADEVWIGLKRTSVYEWTSPLALSQPVPDNITGNGECIAMQNMSLIYTGCKKKYTLICQRAVANSTECMTPWKYHETTKYCYRRALYTSYYMETNLACYTYRASYVTTSVELVDLMFIYDINNQLANSTDIFWIGLSRYAWDDGDHLHWQTWNGVYEMGKQDCVMIYSNHWRDSVCSAEKNFVCQKDGGEKVSDRPSTYPLPIVTTENNEEQLQESTTPTSYTEADISTSIHSQTTSVVTLVTTYSEPYYIPSEQMSTGTSSSRSSQTEVVHVTEESILKIKNAADPILIGGVVGAVVVLILIVVTSVVCCRLYKGKSQKANKGDYDASYEIAYSPNTEDKPRNSDNSLTDDEKLAQLRNRDSRVVIDSNVPDSEKIKPYLVTTIVDSHSEAKPSRRSKVVSSIEDRVEYDNNNLDDLIVTDNDLYHSSGSDPNTSDGRPRSTDYDYAVRPPHPNQQSQANIFINNAYVGEAEGGAGNHNQGAQIQYADIAFSTETLNKENTYADIDDFAPSLAASDAKLPTTTGIDQRGNTPGISNNDADSGNQAGEMKAIPVYAEVDANKMDKNKNEIIDDRKDAHDLEEGVNDLIVTDNDLYDFDN